MKKYTLKELKNFINLEMAIDLTNLKMEEVKLIKEQEKGLDKIGYSCGIYGINGAMFKGCKTNSYYIITSRNTNLFYLV